jgi:hypothetical protein
MKKRTCPEKQIPERELLETGPAVILRILEISLYD